MQGTSSAAGIILPVKTVKVKHNHPKVIAGKIKSKLEMTGTDQPRHADIIPSMETRTYHGEITPQKIAQALLGRFNRGSLIAQQIGDERQIVVQIRTRQRPAAGGQTAVTVTLQEIEDGVSVRIGKQAWLGIAASLGVTALTTLRNPFSLIGRLDDLAQDFEHLQLSEDVWEAISEIARQTDASHLMSERLRRSTCEYCLTANPVGEPQCIACGAPLGEVQPVTCANCGYVVSQRETSCPNCKRPL